MPAKASKRVIFRGDLYLQQTLLSSSSSCPVKKTHTCVASNSKASGSDDRENWASNLAACLKLWLTSTSSHLLLYKLNSFSTTSLFMSGMKPPWLGRWWCKWQTAHPSSYWGWLAWVWTWSHCQLRASSASSLLPPNLITPIPLKGRAITDITCNTLQATWVSGERAVKKWSPRRSFVCFISRFHD